jgi:hypothetical protein
MLAESREAKQQAATELAEILYTYSNEKVKEILIEGDTAIVNYEGGGQRTVGIGCDSVTAMIFDICKEIIR